MDSDGFQMKKLFLDCFQAVSGGFQEVLGGFQVVEECYLTFQAL